MKKHAIAIAASLVFAILGTSRLAADEPGLQLTFDWSQLGNPNLDANNIYVTFAGQMSTMHIGGSINESINFSGGSINYGGMNYGTSKSYTLQQIMDNGLTISSANAMTAYISYGTNSGFQQLPAGSEPNFHSSSLARFTQFEINYGGGSGNIDMTQISQFGGSIIVQMRTADQTVQAYTGNNLNTGDMFRALAAASNNNPSAVFTNSNGTEYTRIIGSNVFISNNPYQPFNAYLQSIKTNAGEGPALPDQIHNLAPGASQGGQGAIGVVATATTSRVTEGETYNINYNYSATITQEEAPSEQFPNGTYSVTLTGIVYSTPADGGDTIVYNGATITIAADAEDNSYMTNFLYLQSVDNPSVNVQFSGWDELLADYGTANVSEAIQQKSPATLARRWQPDLSTAPPRLLRTAIPSVSATSQLTSGSTSIINTPTPKLKPILSTITNTPTSSTSTPPGRPRRTVLHSHTAPSTARPTMIVSV